MASKDRKIAPEVQVWIGQLIRQDLSPQQVADYLMAHKKLALHHETICQIIYDDKVKNGGLYKHLRIFSMSYRKRYGSNDRRGKIKIV